jgi:hypothetical protein
MYGCVVVLQDNLVLVSPLDFRLMLDVVTHIPQVGSCVGVFGVVELYPRTSKDSHA